MVKKEFVKYVASSSGYTQKDALEMVNVVFDCLINAVKEFDKVDIQSVGKFEKKHRKGRITRDIRNPLTEVDIPEFDTMGFKASDLIKERFSNNTNTDKVES